MVLSEASAAPATETAAATDGNGDHVPPAAGSGRDRSETDGTQLEPATEAAAAEPVSPPTWEPALAAEPTSIMPAEPHVFSNSKLERIFS